MTRLLLLLLLLPGLAGAQGFFTQAPQRPSIGATYTPTTVYVRTSGHDYINNCLTSAFACRTIAGALAKVRDQLGKVSIIMDIGAGDFAGAWIPTFLYDVQDMEGGFLHIRGVLVNAPLAADAGAVEGTITTITTGYWPTWTLSGGGWTPGALRGYVLEVEGTGAGVYGIADNTANTVTLAENISGAKTPNSSSKYYIRTWGTRITDGPGVPRINPQTGGTSGNKVGFFLAGTSGTVTRALFIERLFFTSGVFYGIRNESDISVYLYGCRYESSIGVSIQGSGSSYALNSVYRRDNGTYISVGGVGGYGTKVLYVMGTIFDGTKPNGAGTGLTMAIGGIAYGLYNSWNYMSNTYIMDGALSFNITQDRLDTNTGGWGFRTGNPGGVLNIADTTFKNIRIGIGSYGPAKVFFTGTNPVTSSSVNNAFIEMSSGAYVRISSGTTISGYTNDFQMETNYKYSLAELRALSPKTITYLPTGTVMQEL